MHITCCYITQRHNTSFQNLFTFVHYINWPCTFMIRLNCATQVTRKRKKSFLLVFVIVLQFEFWNGICVKLLNNSEYVDVVISGMGRPQENRIFRFLNIHKRIALYPKRKIFSQMFIAWNRGSDGKIKILMIWAL